MFFYVSKYILLFFAFFFVAFELSKEEKKDGDDAPKSKIVGKYSVKNLNQIKPEDSKTILLVTNIQLGQSLRMVKMKGLI